MNITLEIGPNLREASKTLVNNAYYHQNGGSGKAVEIAFGIDFKEGIKELIQNKPEAKCNCNCTGNVTYEIK